MEKEFSKLREKAGLPYVVFHSLRHSSTTYKLKLNHGDLKATQGDTGHSQIDMITDVLGFFRTRLVWVFDIKVGKINMMSLSSNCCRASLDTRASSCSIQRWESSFAISSSEICTLSHVSPYLTPGTIHSIHKILRCAFEQAVKWEIIARNPFPHANKFCFRVVLTGFPFLVFLPICTNLITLP